MEDIEQFDREKTKIFKFILYKKRTEQEVRQKFADCDYLDEIIDYLKEQNYINDTQYIERAVNEYRKLKHMSIREVTYKLQCKGLDRNIIESYINNNMDELMDYELNSARNIIRKKRELSQEELVIALKKKGYMHDTIKQVKSELEDS